MTTTQDRPGTGLSPAETSLVPKAANTARVPSKRPSREEVWAHRLSEAAGGHAEPRLRRWVSTQRRADKVGTLSPQRRQALDRDLPGWNSDRQTRWLEIASDLVDFEDLNGAMPSASGDEDARRLWRWLNHQRTRLAQGKLPKDRRKWLDRKLPGWDTGKAGPGGS